MSAVPHTGRPGSASAVPTAGRPGPASVVPHPGRPRLLAAALARVDDFFFEKVGGTALPHAALETHPRVVVAGLGPRSGATAVARALGVEMAGRAGGAAIVSTARLPARTAPTDRRARRLALAFGGEGVRASGRLCLVETDGDDAEPRPLAPRPLAATAAAARYLAPFVADWPHGRPVSEAAALGAQVVLVAGPAVEPSLAAAVAAAVPGALVVLNRAGALDDWAGSPDVVVPDARIAARLALAGRPARGRFGAAIARIADEVA